MSQTWNLKKSAVAPDAEVVLGRFQDPIDIKKANDLRMYAMEETIAEDPEPVGDDKKKKKRTQRAAKAKTYVVLEEASASSSSSSSSSDREKLQLQGVLVDNTKDNGQTAQYALLQVVNAGSSSEMTVNVIKVGDWYHFRKPNFRRAEISLDDVDTQFEKQKNYQRAANERYKKLTSVLKRVAPEATDTDEKGAPEFFGKNAVKASKSGRSAEVSAAVTDSNNDDENDMGGEGGDLYGRAFGALEEHEYESGQSDDEDDTGAQQKADTMKEEEDEDGALIWNEIDELDTSDEDEDEDDSDAETGATNAVEALKTDSFVVDAAELKDQMQRRNEATDKNNKKRDASDLQGSDSVDSRPAKKERKEGKTSSAGDVISDESVRNIIERVGGRATSKQVFKEFKKYIKKAGDAGKSRLSAVLKSVASLEKDPVQGSVWVLKGRF